MKSYYLYILRCSDGSFYTGLTNNVEKRFQEHQDGLIEGSYTHRKRPLKLMYVAEFKEIADAIAREKQVKGWSRQKKLALIGEEYERLPFLSNKHLLPGRPSTGSG